APAGAPGSLDAGTFSQREASGTAPARHSVQPLGAARRPRAAARPALPSRTASAGPSRALRPLGAWAQYAATVRTMPLPVADLATAVVAVGAFALWAFALSFLVG